MVIPQLVGLEYLAAQLALSQAGILVPTSLGYFDAFPISIKWQQSKAAPSVVLAQNPSVGNFVPVNGPVILTCSEFPMAVSFP